MFRSASNGTAPRFTVLLFIVSLTFLPVNANVVRQRTVTVGDCALSVSAAKVLNKLPDDVH